MSNLTKEELINLIDETFNEYVNDGASKVNAANNVLFAIAKKLILTKDIKNLLIF